MPTVKLYTSDGHFVTEESFLPYVKLPEVVVWGQRFFVWREDHQQYREAFAHWIPPRAS